MKSNTAAAAARSLWRLTPHDNSLVGLYENRNRSTAATVSSGRSVNMEPVKAPEPEKSLVHVHIGGKETVLGESTPLIGDADAAVPGVSSMNCAINIVKCAIGAGSFNVPCVGSPRRGGAAAWLSYAAHGVMSGTRL